MKVIGDPQRLETRLLRHPGLADQLLRGVLLGGQKVPIATHRSTSSYRAGAGGRVTGIASRATRRSEGYSAVSLISASRPCQRRGYKGNGPRWGGGCPRSSLDFAPGVVLCLYIDAEGAFVCRRPCSTRRYHHGCLTAQARGL